MFVALVVAGGMTAFRYAYLWSPLQQRYLKPYIQSSARGAFTAKPTRYPILLVTHPKGTWRATAGDIAPYQQMLAWDWTNEPPAEYADWLRTSIYGGSRLRDMAIVPLLAGLVAGCCIAIPMWARSRRQRRMGRQIDGVNMLTVDQFVRQFGPRWWRFKARRGLRIPQEQSGPDLWLPESHLEGHISITGDTRRGKSTAIRWLLRSIRERGEVAVVLDPHKEYVSEFYDP
jgi:hypothetical protein